MLALKLQKTVMNNFLVSLSFLQKPRTSADDASVASLVETLLELTLYQADAITSEEGNEAAFDEKNNLQALAMQLLSESKVNSL